MIVPPFKAYESAPTINRIEACRMCGALQGKKIAEIQYWDLRESNLVRCDACGLMQYDPMLTPEDIETGCTACGFLSEPAEKEERNCLRNYRRGIAFASRLKHQGIWPKRILEIGPGKGFFSRGVAFVFPGAKVTVLDVVDYLLEYNRQVHGFQILKGTPETSVGSQLAGTFDFIIARDVLEHVSDIGTVITNVNILLEKGGYFNFIAPNGLEDAWSYYACWRLFGKPAQALLNHVNFFDPITLRSYIQNAGFEVQSYYLYTLKHFVRGTGWLIRAKHAAAVSTKKSATEIINKNHGKTETEMQVYNFIHSRLLSSRWFTPLYCRYKHRGGIKISPEMKIGHEIYCLAKKM
jgi:2-polyprenyl-3-methyl-5-hydroxy-6-metoxy-1,4-benzoquinol methylase